MADQSPFSRPYVYVLTISIISTIFFLLLNIYNIRSDLLGPLVGGLATATLASYITSTLINRSFREQEQDRQDRMRDAAYFDLKNPLENHIRLLIEMYIASADQSLEYQPTEYHELFNDDFVDHIKCLNFEEIYPIVDGRMTWGTRIANQMEDFQEEINRVLSLYSAWLDPETVEALQKLRDLTFSSIPIRMSNTGMFVQNIIQTDEQAGLLLEEIIDDIPTHLDLLLQITDQYCNSSELRLREIDDFNVWSENVAPSPGCGCSKTETVHPSDGQWIQLDCNDTGTRRPITGDKILEIYEDQ